jgi:hypothetical protein
MAALILASSAMALVLVALIVVVVAMRQEPRTIELRSQPPTRIAALVRHLLGVSVRRPSPQPTDEDHTPESCLAGHATWPNER